MRRILVFTGLVLAVSLVPLQGAGAATPSSPPSMDTIWQKVIDHIFRTPVMETVSGSFTDSGGTFWPNVQAEYYYPQQRLVTVTLYYENLIAPWEGFGIFAEIDGKMASIKQARFLESPPTSGVLQATFTTDHWQIIDEEENGHATIAGWYSATIEYVP